MLIPLLLFIVYDKTGPALPSCLNLYLGPFSSLEVINSRKINNSFREIPSPTSLLITAEAAASIKIPSAIYISCPVYVHWLSREGLSGSADEQDSRQTIKKRPIGMDDYGDQNRPECGPKEGLVVVVRVVIMTMIIMVKIDWGSSRDGSWGWGRAEKERRWSTQPLLLYWDARGGKSAAQQLPIKFLTRCIPPSDSERAQKRRRRGSSMQEERRLHFVQMLFYS